MTEEERQQKRLKVLQTLQLNGNSRVNVIQQQLASIREKQAELSAVAEMYLGPTLKGIVRKMEPCKSKAKQLLTSGAKPTEDEKKISNEDKSNEAVKALDEENKDAKEAENEVVDVEGKSARSVMDTVVAEAAEVGATAAQSEEE